ncbi:conserved hypothetical protein [Ricinus communis]|uniref:Uncharacterized protein n=1 Tax=Ricinus communis TaxID=3988 RepID=B9SA04_RICCO|nr:conserved hypothetical protein [Ricinus communis]
MVETRSQALLREGATREMDETFNSKIAVVEGKLEEKINSKLSEIDECLKSRMAEMFKAFELFTNGALTSNGRRTSPPQLGGYGTTFTTKFSSSNSGFSVELSEYGRGKTKAMRDDGWQ